LTAAKDGFQTSRPTKIELTARQSLRVDIALALQSQSETVDVNTAEELPGHAIVRFLHEVSRTGEQLGRNDKVATREEAQEWPLPPEWKPHRERDLAHAPSTTTIIAATWKICERPRPLNVVPHAATAAHRL
jgi:hypothetical protein